MSSPSEVDVYTCEIKIKTEELVSFVIPSEVLKVEQTQVKEGVEQIQVITNQDVIISIQYRV